MRTSIDLERRINRFEPASGSVSAGGDELRRLGFRVCTFEDLALGAEAGGVACADATLREALANVVERNPGYRWDVAVDDLVNIVPVHSVLDEPAPRLEIHGKSLSRVLDEDLDLRRRGIELFPGLEADGPAVELVGQPSDLREALNLVVAQLPDTVWHASGRPAAYSLFVTVVERRT
jgi:hypothetical protein